MVSQIQFGTINPPPNHIWWIFSDNAFQTLKICFINKSSTNFIHKLEDKIFLSMGFSMRNLLSQLRTQQIVYGKVLNYQGLKSVLNTLHCVLFQIQIKKLDYIRKLNKNYYQNVMRVGFQKNFKNRMMDFANISSFVNGHPLKCIKS